jgi:hypothetical protein
MNIPSKGKLYAPSVRLLAMIDRQRAFIRSLSHRNYTILQRENNYPEQMIFNIDRKR